MSRWGFSWIHSGVGYSSCNKFRVSVARTHNRAEWDGGRVSSGPPQVNGHPPRPVNLARKGPDCNAPVLYQEGCLLGVACGWNKCE